MGTGEVIIKRWNDSCLPRCPCDQWNYLETGASVLSDHCLMNFSAVKTCTSKHSSKTESRLGCNTYYWEQKICITKVNLLNLNSDCFDLAHLFNEFTIWDSSRPQPIWMGNRINRISTEDIKIERLIELLIPLIHCRISRILMRSQASDQTDDLCTYNQKSCSETSGVQREIMKQSHP